VPRYCPKWKWPFMIAPLLPSFPYHFSISLSLTCCFAFRHSTGTCFHVMHARHLALKGLSATPLSEKSLFYLHKFFQHDSWRLNLSKCKVIPYSYKFWQARWFWSEIGNFIFRLIYCINFNYCILHDFCFGIKHVLV